MTKLEKSKLAYNNKFEICYDYKTFTLKQNKSQDGRLLQKAYLYSKDKSSYYWTVAFATFSSKWLLDRFMEGELK